MVSGCVGDSAPVLAVKASIEADPRCNKFSNLLAGNRETCADVDAYRIDMFGQVQVELHVLENSNCDSSAASLHAL